jgi:hypothetical protein
VWFDLALIENSLALNLYVNSVCKHGRVVRVYEVCLSGISAQSFHFYYTHINCVKYEKGRTFSLFICRL